MNPPCVWGHGIAVLAAGQFSALAAGSVDEDIIKVVNPLPQLPNKGFGKAFFIQPSDWALKIDGYTASTCSAIQLDRSRSSRNGLHPA
jgi:hypothetical protein